MDSLRELQTQYAEKSQQLDELNFKIRQHIGKASPEELKAISNRQDSDRFAFDDQQKIVDLALGAVTASSSKRIWVLKMWVAGTVMFMAILIGVLMSGIDE